MKIRTEVETCYDIEFKKIHFLKNYFLEACREEFHRRLKVYHAWKARNRKKDTPFDDGIRAPSSVTEQANKMTSANGPSRKSVISTDQRYFRLPFVRPNSSDSARGWWYAHFDGDWIARQMELHPGIYVSNKLTSKLIDIKIYFVLLV